MEMRSLFWFQHLPKTFCAFLGYAQVQPSEYFSHQTFPHLWQGSPKETSFGEDPKHFPSFPNTHTYIQRQTGLILLYPLPANVCLQTERHFFCEEGHQAKQALDGCESCCSLLLWLSQSSIPLPYLSLLRWFHPLSLSQRSPYCYTPRCFPGSISIKWYPKTGWEGDNGAVDHIQAPGVVRE